MQPRRPRITKVIAISVTVLVALAAALVVYLRSTDESDEPAASSPAAASAPLTTRKVQVNGHQLVIQCQGSGSPAVILDSDVGVKHALWGDILRGTANLKVQVCAYDRWGVGDSDANPTGRQTVADAAQELFVLLRSAGVKPPYVLVGHSLAGLIDRYYTKLNPDDVTGLVMLDAMPDDWGTQSKGSEATAGGETISYGHELISLSRQYNFGDRPLVVVQAESENSMVASTALLQPLMEYWGPAQRKLAALSTNSILVTATGSDHNIPLFSPDLVAAAIGLVANAAQSGKKLSACASSPLPKAGGAC